jgi:hypothetical protein
MVPGRCCCQVVLCLGTIILKMGSRRSWLLVSCKDGQHDTAWQSTHGQ